MFLAFTTSKELYDFDAETISDLVAKIIAHAERRGDDMPTVTKLVAVVDNETTYEETTLDADNINAAIATQWTYGSPRSDRIRAQEIREAKLKGEC